uniref:Phosphoribosyltransferase domain-containing protein n=1 Tax=Lotharella globosa TaxID=91324 RepID=A0A7S3YFK5_9EUKA
MSDAKGAKQDPAEKARRVKAADGRVYFSYAQIHAAVSSMVPKVKAFKPDVIIAIGGGGFIPARMLRTEIKVPILAVSLKLYDDATNTVGTEVEKVQWFDETSGVGKNVRGKRVLIVDEVDDSRTTLKYCVDEVKKTNAPAALAVLVVHNKMRPKAAQLPSDVEYMACEDVENFWNCYPWDAAAYGRDIYAHEELARQCLKGGNGVNPSGFDAHNKKIKVADGLKNEVMCITRERGFPGTRTSMFTLT